MFTSQELLICIATQKRPLTYHRAGTFVTVQLVSFNMARPIKEHLYCFNHSENNASGDVNNRMLF